jgi:hypothetical protein
MIVGFLNNQMDGRGTGNAVYNYAHFNEEILGNKSKIFTFPNPNHEMPVVDKFTNRFNYIYNVLEEGALKDVDVLYHIQSGHDYVAPPIPYAIHAVFGASPSILEGGALGPQDSYAVISEWMAQRDGLPFVPHIVNLPDTDADLRAPLGIPDDATVFGRHGGSDTFDIPFVWEALEEVIEVSKNTWMLFVNTDHRNPPLLHERIKYFPHTLDEQAKKAFINTCDAMLHARGRGETFGISVGEFSASGKHIFTYGDSPEKAHIYELRGTAFTYTHKEELVSKMLGYKRNPAHPFYQYTPDKVMEQFKEVFLDGLGHSTS